MVKHVQGYLQYNFRVKKIACLVVEVNTQWQGRIEIEIAP